YDLHYFGWIHVAMTRDWPWVAWRTAIVTQFLLLVGLGLVLRGTNQANDAAGERAFWRRWGQIAAAAALVSAGSWWVFRERLIWFGILHFVAVALVLGRPLVRLGGAANFLLGAAVLALGLSLHSPAFDDNAWSWIGFAAHKPPTEDFVPVFPWLGVVLAGIGAGSLWRRRGFALVPALDRVERTPPRPLLFLGRWPLTVYLLHQPLMLGALGILRQLITQLIRQLAGS
ncbi:MAG TPA: heparan-alpha-glucosaminide N-acetyltransferase, partial [Burkholderiaceae bacterium]